MTIQNQCFKKPSNESNWARITAIQKASNCVELHRANNLEKSHTTQTDKLRNKEISLHRNYCNLIVVVVAEKYSVPIKMIMNKTRATANAALARQIAVYLAHTTLSVTYRAAANFFGRDRTTIAHACRLVEDLRDDDEFDVKLSQIEALIVETAIQLHGFRAPEALGELTNEK